MPGGPLSRAQIESFKAEGVLILPDFVEEAQLARWREQVWAGLGADPDDRSTWPTHTQHPPVADGISPTPGDLPQFQALMDQLGGGFFEGGGAQHACIFPSLEASEWKKPGSGHVDGYNGRWAGVGAHRLGTTFYLDDCEERGGCFTYLSAQFLLILSLSDPQTYFLDQVLARRPRAGARALSSTPGGSRRKAR